MPEKKKKKVLGFNLKKRFFSSLKSFDLTKLKKNPLTWYLMIVLGMTLSLFTIFGSIDRFSTRQAEQHPFSTMIEKSPNAGLPLALYIGNITDSQIAVALITEKAEPASLYLFDKNDQMLRQIIDARSKEAADNYHMFIIDGLSANSEYGFRVCNSEDCQAQLKQQATKSNSDIKIYGLKKQANNLSKINPNLLSQADLLGGFLNASDPIKIKTGSWQDINARDLALSYGLTDEKTSFKNSSYFIRFYVPEKSDKNSNLSSQLIDFVNLNDGWAMDLANLRKTDLSAFYNLKDNTSIYIQAVRFNGKNLSVLEEELSYKDVKDKEIRIMGENNK